MPASWKIGAEWETLDSGTPEERACFAQLRIDAADICLTEGRDALANRLRQAPLLSAYHLAEWMAWNWWRLRWEPRSKASDWAFAHRVATIGGGYIWPNMTIFSDGERTALVAEPTNDRPKTPFRYITDRVIVIPASEFESEFDWFADQVLERLRSQNVADSNFEKIWASVRQERRDPKLAQARKLEALLGHDPDESDPRAVKQLILDSQDLSAASVEELAAEHGQGKELLNAERLREIASEKGFDAKPSDVVRLRTAARSPRGGQIPAWRLGADAARALREQEVPNGKPISDEKLAGMAGVEAGILQDRQGAPGISFALDENANRGRVVLRSKWHEGRRFELARLLGDRIAAPGGARLLPATRAYTYRQKMQRSFAAEFLAPFDAVDEFLESDYSSEKQQDAAARFIVSPITIRTLLVNHGRIGREELEHELEAEAA
jgi:hypothetical protein